MRLEDDGKLHFRARIGGMFPPGREGRTFTPGSEDEGVAGWVARIATPIFVAIRRPTDSLWGSLPACPIRSMVCVPIVSHGVVLGVINVDSPEPKRFSVADRELLAALASQVARAVERAELLEGLQAISEKTLSGAADLYQSIVDTIHGLTRCSVAMWRVDEKDRSRAKIAAQRGLREEYVKDRVLDLSKSATGVAIDTGRLVEVEDIQADPRVALETKEEAADTGLDIDTIGAVDGRGQSGRWDSEYLPEQHRSGQQHGRRIYSRCSPVKLAPRYSTPNDCRLFNTSSRWDSLLRLCQNRPMYSK